MGWLIAFVILLLPLFIPLGVRLIYSTVGFQADVIAGPVKFQIFPSRKNNKKKHAEKRPRTQEKEPSKKKSAGSNTASPKEGGSLTDFIPLIKTALALLNDFRKKLRVNHLEVNIVLAGGDPCDLAVNYGKAWAAVGNILPCLERFLVIKERNIQVGCDFSASGNLIYACADITITLGRLLYLLLRYGIRVLREFIQIKNKRKGGRR